MQIDGHVDLSGQQGLLKIFPAGWLQKEGKGSLVITVVAVWITAAGFCY